MLYCYELIDAQEQCGVRDSGTESGAVLVVFGGGYCAEAVGGWLWAPSTCIE
jgi:hypothetical protein